MITNLNLELLKLLHRNQIRRSTKLTSNFELNNVYSILFVTLNTSSGDYKSCIQPNTSLILYSLQHCERVLLSHCLQFLVMANNNMNQHQNHDQFEKVICNTRSSKPLLWQLSCTSFYGTTFFHFGSSIQNCTFLHIIVS